jgi:N6-L-threonylcarbamoyladenine synthase/ribosomal-protein-alanine N-acetyltransferase
MSHQIRVARESDLDQIMQIEKASFGSDSWSKPNMKSELLARHTTYLVAEENNSVIGYAGLSKLASSTTSDIQTIAVSDSHRGRGIGRALIQNLLDYAREQKAKEVLLEVREDRPNPQSLYKSLGFLTIDRRENYYQPDGVAAIVMRLELGSEK